MSFRILEPEKSPPVGPVLDACRAFIASAPWTFASSMPRIPHEYTTRWACRRLGIEPAFDRFATLIWSGYRGQFGRAERYYLNVDAHRYWSMEPRFTPPIAVLNRALREPESAQLSLEVDR